MRVKILDCGKLSEFAHGREHGASETVFRRRQFMIGSAVAAAGFVLPPLVTTHSVRAQMPLLARLIPAGINALQLIRTILQMREPTSGNIRLENHLNYTRQGDILFQVFSPPGFGPTGVDNYASLPFSVEPNSYKVYGFDDGPYGTSVGPKIFSGRSQFNEQRVNMTIRVG